MAKYRLLRQRVVEEGILGAHDLQVPEAATDQELALVHDNRYLDRVIHGALERQEVRALGFPWSPELVERSRRSVGGTIGAARAALREGAGVNLAGGTHHAFPDRASGYCVFNDVGVALTLLLRERAIGRAAVVDCDVHQGDGTARVFRHEPRVFTLSLHARRNFPFRKERSDLDIELEDGTSDAEYLEALDEGLGKALAHRPELVIYVAGADPFVGDRLGRLSLSKSGLAERDRRVFEACRIAGVPVGVVMAGGYAEDVMDTVEIHAATVREALRRVSKG